MKSTTKSNEFPELRTEPVLKGLVPDNSNAGSEKATVAMAISDAASLVTVMEPVTFVPTSVEPRSSVYFLFHSLAHIP